MGALSFFIWSEHQICKPPSLASIHCLLLHRQFVLGTSGGYVDFDSETRAKLVPSFIQPAFASMLLTVCVIGSRFLSRSTSYRYSVSISVWTNLKRICFLFLSKDQVEFLISSTGST